jgi:two-component system nitrate/nitrite sensor histidine kinase NarX
MLRRLSLPKLRLTRLGKESLPRIVILLLVVGLVVIYEIAERLWPDTLDPDGWIVARAILSGLAAFLVGNWILQIFKQKEQMTADVEQVQSSLQQASQRQQAVFRLARQFVESTDDEVVINQFLLIALELSGGKGASFVPYDERGQPLAAVSRGELPQAVMESWAEFQADQVVRQRCQACLAMQAEQGADCPLLHSPLTGEIPGVRGLRCFHLRCGDRQVGLLTLYLSEEKQLDQETESFLSALVDEMAVGLESSLLRRREVSALQQLQAVREKTDINRQLTELLGNVQENLKADYAMLILRDPMDGSLGLRLTRGDLPVQSQSFLQDVLLSILSSGQSFALGEVVDLAHAGQAVRAILAAPLAQVDAPALGAVLVGYSRPQTFTRRQLGLLQTVAGQITLVVKNAHLVTELEYKTVLEERARLAREIHDGLAQTLGFLKLQVAQLQNYLDKDEKDRLRKGLQTSYATLSDAYLDVRDAIDNLRVSPQGGGLAGWLMEALKEYEENTGIKTALENGELLNRITPEVQVQVMRILQEALSNTRKHASAERVWIACQLDGRELAIAVRDNGRGFSPEDVTPASQYGLRGIGERAELIGAEFQILSKPGSGTTLRVSLPLDKEPV